VNTPWWLDRFEKLHTKQQKDVCTAEKPCAASLLSLFGAT
jgi:hypothetical protein